MLIDKEYEVNWNRSNREHYTSLGYIFTKMKDSFFVDVNDISKYSKIRVKYICDYCKKIKERNYVDIIEGRKVVNKDACKQCTGKKAKESNEIRYGIQPQNLSSVKEKAIQTNRTKYGSDFFTQTDEYKEKYRKTIFDKHGVKHYSQTKEFKDKFKETHLDKYGVEHTFQSDVFLKKREKTYIERYGVDNPMKDPEIANSLLKKLCESGKLQCSKQQAYIHSVIGGELNFPIDNVALDIAFSDKKIYVEYNGGGHDLQVKIGKTTKEEFLEKEKRRYYFLKRLGWKMIEISSSKDFIPKEEVLLSMINLAENKFKEGYSSLSFNIDNSTLRYNGETIDYDFGELKLIRSNKEVVV